MNRYGNAPPKMEPLMGMTLLSNIYVDMDIMQTRATLHCHKDGFLEETNATYKNWISCNRFLWNIG